MRTAMTKTPHGFRATRVGGVTLECMPAIVVAGAGSGLAVWMGSLMQLLHAAGIAGLGMLVAVGLVFAAFTAGRISAALRAPRLRSAGFAAPPDADALLAAVFTTGEGAMSLAQQLRSSGQRELADRLADEAASLVRSSLEVEARRARLRSLPGTRSRAAARVCDDALADLGDAIERLGVALAETGAAEELTGARLADALAAARAATNGATASAEAAFVGIELGRMGRV